MNIRRINNKDIVSYQNALDAMFSIDKCVLDADGVKKYFQNIDDGEVLTISLPCFVVGQHGHRILLAKEKGKYYLYDPNGEDFFEPQSLEYISGLCVSYLEEFQGSEEIKTYTLNIERLKTGNKGGSQGGNKHLRIPAQSEFMKIVAAYYNAVYKPNPPVTKSGVCAGLSAIFRELIVSTGSVHRAKEVFHTYLEELTSLEKEIGLFDETSKEDLERIAPIMNQSKLILSMIPFFQATQISKVSDASVDADWKGSYPVDEQGNMLKDGAEAIGLKGVMFPLTIKIVAEDGKEVVSNPQAIYDMLNHLSDDEYQKLIDQTKVREVLSESRSSVEISTCDDWGMLLAEIAKDEKVLEQISDELKANRHFMMAAIDRNGKAVDYALIPDNDYVFLLYKIVRFNMDEQSDKIRAIRQNKDFITSVCQKDVEAIQFAANSLKHDPEFIEALLDLNVEILAYLPQEFRNNPDFVWEAMLKDKQAYNCASYDLQCQTAFVLLYYYLTIKDALVKSVELVIDYDSIFHLHSDEIEEETLDVAEPLIVEKKSDASLEQKNDNQKSR